MKKSRIIALFTAAVMIMSFVPAMAAENEASVGGYFVDDEGSVYEKSGENMIENPSFEDGELTGLTENEEYYRIASYEYSHSGSNSLAAIKSTKGDGAITAYFPVGDADESYYLSFWYLNTDSVSRRPRVTFAFTDSSKKIPTEEDDFTDATHAWVQAGTASNDKDMAYSKGEWVQYSTVLKGNGNQDACKYVVLNIYGLTKDVTYVDDFELYKLSPSEEYGDKFAEAVENWKNIEMPKGSLEGFGTLELPRDTGVEGVSVNWDTSETEIIDTETGDYSSPAEETLVILSAILYIDNKDIRYVFDYPYIAKSMFDPYVEWVNAEVFATLGNSISGDVSLPSAHEIDGYYPATITWSCSDEAVLDGEGKFAAPETTKYVDIIATIECNGQTTTATKRIKALGGNIVGNGLIMYYDFEKPLGSKDTLYDNSQNENVYNATVENVTLIDGYAYVNGGTIKLPTNYATELTGSYSVSMWANLDKSIATSGAMYRFFDFGGDTYHSQFLRYIPGTGQISFMDRGTVENGDTWAINTNVTGMAQTWKLVTLTYEKGTSSSKATLYIDGQEIANSGDNTTLTNSISQVAATTPAGFIGRTQWANGDNPDFVGLMDDVRVYNRAITADEVVTLYNETRPTVTAPVTIKFQDVNGETLKEDVVLSADVDTDFEVPASYKTLPSSSDDQYRYIYKYLVSKSTDSVYVSADSENVCTLVFELEKQPKGSNLIENGSFENGTAGWTNRQGTDITGATVEYDNSIGANVMKIATEGKSSTQTIGTVWNVEIGKDYTISFDIYTGKALDANNYTYNRLSDGFKLGDVGQRENSGQDIIAWGASLTANSWTHFEKDFTATTDTLYFQSSWSAGEMKFTNFVLEEAGDSPNPEPDTDKIPVTIKYVDTEGNTLQDDVVVNINQGVNEYTVPASYKTIADKIVGSVIYKYTYNADATKRYDETHEDTYGDVVSISILRDNVATLVFDVLKADKNSNIMVDGSFEDENGNFSLGTWLSCQTSATFGSPYSTDHAYAVTSTYHVNNNSQTSATTVIPDGNWAFGTRWNDGTAGLCSMANFVPVEKGKTYIVSYDYKHKTAGTDASYISTSFVTSKSIGAGSASGSNIPQNVSTEWQTNTFTITAPSDGYIYFHFSYLGSNGAAGGNDGSGPYWYFDNFEVLEVITFENKIEYVAGYAEIVAEDGTTGYVVQAVYNNEGALESVEISEEYTFNKETPVKVPVTKGAKVMVFKSVTNGTEGFLEPIAPAIIAE